MPLRRATVSSQAAGASGMPSRGQCWSALTSASWTSSSARSKSPSVRVRRAVRRPASSRKTRSMASVVVLSLARPPYSRLPDGSDQPDGPDQPRVTIGRTSTAPCEPVGEGIAAQMAFHSLAISSTAASSGTSTMA